MTRALSYGIKNHGNKNRDKIVTTQNREVSHLRTIVAYDGQAEWQVRIGPLLDFYDVRKSWGIQPSTSLKLVF